MEVLYKREEIQKMPVIKWEDMPADSEGSPILCPDIKILSVSFDGTFGGGSEVVLEGAIEDTFFALTNRNGSLIMARIPLITTVDGRYMKIRPRVLGGSDRTSIRVTILGQRLR